MACVHIYCGDGKGKTSAAVGLAIRAAGRGIPVIMTRFMKNDDSGEIASLTAIPGIYVIPSRKSFGFYKNMTAEQKREAGLYYRELLEEAWRMAADAAGAGGEDVSGSAGGPKAVKKAVSSSNGHVTALLVLDEIAAACSCGFADVPRLAQLLDGRPPGLEVVMTGRNPAPELLGRADYISEIWKVKHPYDEGISARRGIEY